MPKIWIGDWGHNMGGRGPFGQWLLFGHNPGWGGWGGCHQGWSTCQHSKMWLQTPPHTKDCQHRDGGGGEWKKYTTIKLYIWHVVHLKLFLGKPPCNENCKKNATFSHSHLLSENNSFDIKIHFRAFWAFSGLVKFLPLASEVGNLLLKEPCKSNFPWKYADKYESWWWIGPGPTSLFQVCKVHFLEFWGSRKFELNKELGLTLSPRCK